MNYDLAKLMKQSLEGIKKIASGDEIKEKCIERFVALGILKEKDGKVEEYHYIEDGFAEATKDNWFENINSENIIVRCKTSYENFITTPTEFYLSGKHYPNLGEEGCILFKKL